MISADRSLRGGVLRAFTVVALAVLTFGALQVWNAHHLYREAAALQHLLFARVTPLGEARSLVYQMEADLRALRYFPPADRARILASASDQIRQNRRALDAALEEYLVLHPESGIAAGERRLLEVAREKGAETMRREEEHAVGRLREALPRLDQLAERIVAGEQTPVGNIEYTINEVGEPLARLAALNRSYVEMAAAEVERVRRRLTLLSLALLGLVVLATAGAGVALARFVDRVAGRERA
ncbi:MAG: hypothetical protein M3P24_08555, partial [Gemmatimonadota bacterium]|nr:hypothetical protein [Gemmatimonadota bacterium]